MAKKGIPNLTFDENGQPDHQAFANALQEKLGEKVQLTYVNDADSDKVRQWIQTDANDPNRDAYTFLGQSCGSQACDAIKSGVSTGRKIVRNIPRKILDKSGLITNVVGAIKNKDWRSLLPFTPASYRDDFTMQGYGTYTSE